MRRSGNRYYVRAADTRELAAAVPLACSYGYSSPADPRYHATVAAVRQSLGVDSSPLLYRIARRTA